MVFVDLQETVVCSLKTKQQLYLCTIQLVFLKYSNEKEDYKKRLGLETMQV